MVVVFTVGGVRGCGGDECARGHLWSAFRAARLFRSAPQTRFDWCLDGCRWGQRRERMGMAWKSCSGVFFTTGMMAAQKGGT